MADPALGLETNTASGGRAVGAAPSRVSIRRHAAWLGLVPFIAFVFLFLVLPALGVVSKAIVAADGGLSLVPMWNALRREDEAFTNSLWVSLLSALIGAVLGSVLAYAAATARRPRWLRAVVTAFSGVGANMGGVILAFMFFTLIGRAGVLTKILRWAGWDLYAGRFELSDTPGLVTIYLYFQIPLMVLVMLPAIDGLKPAWREAAHNLGANSWGYWSRVGLPVLAPSLLGGFLLLFANAFSAFATAAVINPGTNFVPTKISFYLQGDVAKGGSMPFALATWMIVVMAVCMGGYLLLRRHAERWRRQ